MADRFAAFGIDLLTAGIKLADLLKHLGETFFRLVVGG
jgi:hypothetical protein